MIDVNWDLAPEGADSLKMNSKQVVRFFKGHLRHVDGSYISGFNNDCEWKTIATRPTQTKTVADAEYKKPIDISEMREGMTVKCVRADSGCYKVGSQYVVGRDKDGYFGPLNEKGLASFNHQAYSFELVETKEQEGEKWTHTYSDYGVRKDCILIHDKPDIHGQVLVLNRYDEYVLSDTVELKPIKPTISTKEYDMLAKYAGSLNVDPAEFEQYMSENYESQLKD